MSGVFGIFMYINWMIWLFYLIIDVQIVKPDSDSTVPRSNDEFQQQPSLLLPATSREGAFVRQGRTSFENLVY
jgi:hypothetical protein